MPQVVCAKKDFDSYLDQFGIPTIALTPKMLTNTLIDNKKVLKYLKDYIKQHNLSSPIEIKKTTDKSISFTFTDCFFNFYFLKISTV